jgi:hypothetical protein
MMMHHQIANNYGLHNSSDRGFLHRRRSRVRLDARKRRLIKGVSQGMTIAEAGTFAGYTHRQAAHRAFRSIQLQIPEALECTGYPVDKMLTKLVEVLFSQLEATKTRILKYQGVVTDTKEFADHRIQLRAAIELSKLFGRYP